MYPDGVGPGRALMIALKMMNVGGSIPPLATKNKK
jgi:hypothetical protein